jgi:hypothetical protein
MFRPRACGRPNRFGSWVEWVGKPPKSAIQKATYYRNHLLELGLGIRHVLQEVF